jgi:hypothetical protein
VANRLSLLDAGFHVPDVGADQLRGLGVRARRSGSDPGGDVLDVAADPVVIGEKRLDHAHGLGHLGPRHPLAGALEQLSRLLPALMAAAAQLPDTAPSTDEFGPEITHEAWSERFAAINGALGQRDYWATARRAQRL